MRWLRAGLAVTVIALVMVPLGVLAASSAKPGDGPPRSLAVSVPSDPVTLGSGENAKIQIRIVDPGSTPVTVTVRGEGIDLGDDGTVHFTGEPDPKWQGKVDFPPGDLMVPAMGFVNVPITVRMPASIPPDLYYIGFVVRPVVMATGITVVNQIGAFITIDVPGPRVRNLSGELKVPAAALSVSGFNTSLVIGNQVTADLTVRNIGQAAVLFWGETAANAFGDSTVTPRRIDKSLLPIGRQRSLRISARSVWPIDLITVRVTLTYPGKTESATKQIVVTRHILVVNPWVIVAVCGLTVVFVLWRLRVRRRRSAARSKSGTLDRKSDFG